MDKHNGLRPLFNTAPIGPEFTRSYKARRELRSAPIRALLALLVANAGSSSLSTNRQAIPNRLTRHVVRLSSLFRLH